METSKRKRNGERWTKKEEENGKKGSNSGSQTRYCEEYRIRA